MVDPFVFAYLNDNRTGGAVNTRSSADIVSSMIAVCNVVFEQYVVTQQKQCMFRLIDGKITNNNNNNANNNNVVITSTMAINQHARYIAVIASLQQQAIALLRGVSHKELLVRQASARYLGHLSEKYPQLLFSDALGCMLDLVEVLQSSLASTSAICKID
jgi:hypothetical protein